MTIAGTGRLLRRPDPGRRSRSSTTTTTTSTRPGGPGPDSPRSRRGRRRSATVCDWTRGRRCRPDRRRAFTGGRPNGLPLAPTLEQPEGHHPVGPGSRRTPAAPVQPSLLLPSRAGPPTAVLQPHGPQPRMACGPAWGTAPDDRRLPPLGDFGALVDRAVPSGAARCQSTLADLDLTQRTSAQPHRRGGRLP